MIDTKKLLANIDTNSLVGKMLGGMATKNFAAGLLTGGLGSTLLRKDGVENLAKMGGLAVLGTLAYKAYGNYQQQKSTEKLNQKTGRANLYRGCCRLERCRCANWKNFRLHSQHFFRHLFRLERVGDEETRLRPELPEDGRP